MAWVISGMEVTDFSSFFFFNSSVPDIRKLQRVLSEPESAPTWETDAVSCLNSTCHEVIAGQGDLNK